ncbi:hypothetical protein GQ53DRAFT_159059 [Thozetella sp. PMI_491]|nr:hypothetical protein GQ53DRAFT_159059 [Thozetella sp. PMI_491]
MAIDSHISDSALSAVLETSQAACEQALGLVQLLEQASAAAANDSEAQAEIAKQQKLLTSNLAQLRGLHRSAQFSARETKSQTAEARQEVDRLHLQLQNLYYEERHLEDEITACESFDHTYTQLPLIPVEEFLALHPDHADDDENALMVARINYERAEREKLEQQRLELVKRKAKLISDNKRRRDDLTNLDMDLEKFIDASKPIQKIFEKNV